MLHSSNMLYLVFVVGEYHDDIDRQTNLFLRYNRCTAPVSHVKYLKTGCAKHLLMATRQCPCQTQPPEPESLQGSAAQPGLASSGRP